MRSSNGCEMSLQRIRRRDEKYFRQIERQIEVVVAERMVLRRIKISRMPPPDRRGNRVRVCPLRPA